MTTSNNASVGSDQSLDPFIILGETLHHILNAKKIELSEVKEKQAYSFVYATEKSIFPTLVWIRPNFNQLFVHVMLPIRVSQDRRAQVAEFFTRVNFGLPIGNFELNFDTGESRFKSSLDFEGTILLPALIDNTLGAALHNANLYLPLLVDIVDYSKEPTDVYQLPSLKNDQQTVRW
jgi:hypothetical protein